MFGIKDFVFLIALPNLPEYPRMKAFKIIVLFIFLVTGIQSQAGVLVLNGIYQGKDLYVKNPFAADGVGFCVFEVQVNGQVTKDEVNSSAFAIDFSILGIDIGSAIEIRIKHKEECQPLVLNPEAIKPISTFIVDSIFVTNDKILEWHTSAEVGELPYIIEQFRWNKWVKAGEVQGKGSNEKHSYQFKITAHSGINKVRVKQTDYTNKPRYSKIIEFQGASKPVTFEPKRVDSDITFSAATQFEIFDEYGNLIKKGFDRTVDVSSLEKGEYYLNYDNSFGETFRKK